MLLAFRMEREANGRTHHESSTLATPVQRKLDSGPLTRTGK